MKKVNTPIGFLMLEKDIAIGPREWEHVCTTSFAGNLMPQVGTLVNGAVVAANDLRQFYEEHLKN